MADLFENPLGTDGFEFVEYTGDRDKLHKIFTELGFVKVAKHKHREVFLYRQGRINFVLNARAGGQGPEFAETHKLGANAMAFRVKDAKASLERALAKGAKQAPDYGEAEGMHIPAIEGIGGTLLYFVDHYGDAGTIYDEDFDFITEDRWPAGAGLTYIDHLTHNVERGNMDKWAGFYEDIFNFQEVRYFDIEGKLTGLKSRAMTSPCGKIRIPINESSDDKSQIQEFLDRFNGEGIQHIALGTDDIFTSIATLRDNGVPFQSTPDTYFDNIDKRLPGHGEDVEKLRALNILIDGAPTDGQGILLQIFTQDAMGPVFFEFIQRKGNEGFGEGNFQALFESIEQDQIRRGVLEEAS
jgi:4-hydroxyphenylpyruvate dioxygenase